MKNAINIVTILLAGVAYSQIKNLLPEYTAGQRISLVYREPANDLRLIACHSYGSFLIKGTAHSEGTEFIIPPVIFQKTGRVDLKLFEGSARVWSGSTEIRADTSSMTIESYCGPKHFVVGKNDFSMLVVSVLDSFDNPFPNRTSIAARALISAELTYKPVITDGLLGFTEFYASDASGYGSVVATKGNSSSTEFKLDFYATEPDNFTLTVDRQHDYADGLQLVTISSSVIADHYGNILENGTLVYIEITDHKGKITTAGAGTIDGRISIALPAPSYATTWEITGYISNFASALPQKISFLPAFNEIPVSPTPGGIRVGPVKSFMGQYAREGMPVHLEFKQEERVMDYQLDLTKGTAYFEYKDYFVPAGSYLVTVSMEDLSNSRFIDISYD